MKRKLKLFFITAILLMLLIACSSIESGEVVDKSHMDEYVTFIYVCGGTNCSSMIMIPQFWPEVWNLTLYDKNSGESGDISVDEATYSKYHFGDQYP